VRGAGGVLILITRASDGVGDVCGAGGVRLIGASVVRGATIGGVLVDGDVRMAHVVVASLSGACGARVLGGTIIIYGSSVGVGSRDVRLAVDVFPNSACGVRLGGVTSLGDYGGVRGASVGGARQAHDGAH
jgi:hypothetical protein